MIIYLFLDKKKKILTIAHLKRVFQVNAEANGTITKIIQSMNGKKTYGLQRKYTPVKTYQLT